MSHEYAQTGPSHVRLYSGDVESFPSFAGQVPFVLGDIRSPTGSPVRNAATINSCRRPSDRPPPLAARGDTYYTTSHATQYQAIPGGPPPNNYTQAYTHDLRIFDQGNTQHQDESGITRPVIYFTQLEGSSDHLPSHSAPGNPQSRIVSNFTQTTHGDGSMPNSYSRVARNGIYLNLGNEIESTHGWYTTNGYSPTYSHAGYYNSAHSTLAIPQNNAIPSFIQPPHDEVSIINDFALFPHQRIDQPEVASIAAVCPTHRHPSTPPQHRLTYSSVSSVSRDRRNDAEPYFNRAMHSESLTMNDPRALHNNMGPLLSDTSEWCSPVDRDNDLQNIQSAAVATGWFLDDPPFTEPYYASPHYSSAYSVPGSPHNTIFGGTQGQGQAPYQMTDNYPVSPTNNWSEYRMGARKSACKWNDGNGPCGKNIILSWGSIREHVTSCHLGSRLPTNYLMQCRWKDCQLEECIRRDTTARHVCEVHFGIKRPKSKGVRNMIP